MPDHIVELEAANRVRHVSLVCLGRDLGEPVLHDDGSRDSRYDIEFPDATPPVALEVTSIVDVPFVETAGASLKVADKATDAAFQADTGK